MSPASARLPERQVCTGHAGKVAPDTRDLTGLRIALISGNYNCVRDGANRAQNMLVRYLLDRGAAVRIYSPTIDEPAFEPVGDLVSVPSSPLPFGRKEYRIAWRLTSAVEEDIQSFRPNIMHLSLPLLHGRSALKLAQRISVPAVAAMHTRFETYPRYYGMDFFERPLVRALTKFYSACDRVVAPSPSIAEAMEAQGMAKNVGIWTRGVDLGIFNAARRDMEWRRARGFRDDTPVIAFLGRLVPEKGLEDFARIVTRLREDGRDFHTLVIGDGPAREEFSHRLADACFVGFQHGAELARALASADLLLNPSSTEAFSNVSLEAMACGVPVVAAYASGNRDVVVDGQNGMLVTPGDIDGYLEALKRYLDHPSLRERHVASALAHACNFTWDRANQGMVDAYFSALSLTEAQPRQVAQ